MLLTHFSRCRPLSPMVPTAAAMLRLQLSHRSYAAQKVPYTYERYTALKRGPYKKLDNDDIAYFTSVLTPQGVVTDSVALEAANIDWLRKYRGNSRLILKPNSAVEVSLVLQYCNEKRLAVVPQGGNTGLVGGGVPVFDEIVLNMGRRNKVNFVDELSGIVICGAGCILENLNNYLEPHGLVVPLDVGSKGSCQIGGNLATNAGGVRVLRYGSLHGNVLGVKAVMADGTILDTISPCRKDNTGYDLKQLFIGSEGTLGVITTVALLVARAPKAVNVAFVGCNTFEDVCGIMAEAKMQLAEILSACEFMDASSMDCVEQHLHRTSPLGTPYPFYVLLETSGSDNNHDTEKLYKMLETLMAKSLCAEGTVAQDMQQVHDIWALREGVTEALLHDGAVYKYDVSLPIKNMYDPVRAMKERVPQATRVVGYGHIGDGNLHLNLTSPTYNPELVGLVEPFIYQYIAAQHGSVSAEHGLGFMKSDCIGFSKSTACIELMRSLKTMMDPHHILNPYKTLPQN